MPEFTLASHVPLPTRRAGCRTYPFGRMRVNDSFFVAGLADGLRAAGAAYVWGRRHGATFRARQVAGEGGVGVRVWRVA